MSSKQPVIKWSGSKRLQATRIISYFPKEFGTYFEPFLGGGSVLLQLLPTKAVCCDVNASLIDFWNRLKDNPQKLADDYEYNWNELQKDWTYFLKVRERYNKQQSGSDLLFLSRTCVNGLIRYNKKGEFNNSLHYSRKGIEPDTLCKLLIETSSKIQNYTFICSDYFSILPLIRKDDLVYLDPPYYHTKSMYYGKIDYQKLWDFINELKKKDAFFALSFDGTNSKRDYSINVPGNLFEQHLYISSGKSTFNKVIDDTMVENQESLFLSEGMFFKKD
jgi:DNA adenine methylase